MDIRVILALSIVLQMTAAGVALALIRVTGRRLAWALIAIAISLMAVRRVITFSRVLASDIPLPSDLSAELVALMISVLMLGGLALIVPLFRSIRRSGNAIAKSEEKYRTLVETANDLVLILSPEGSLVFVNRASRQTLGYDENEMRGRSIFDFVHADMKNHCMEQLAEILHGERVDHVEAVLISKDGSSIIVEGRCNVTYEDGKPIAVLVIFRDITQRKQAEDALRENENRYRQLVEATHVVPWEANASTWQFTYVGPQAEELLGYPPEAWYADGFWVDHLHPDDRQAAAAFCQRQTADDKDHEHEYRMIKSDGETVWVRDIVSVVHSEEAPTLLRGVLVDISEHKQTEEALRESRQRMHHLLVVSPAVIYSCEPGPRYATTFMSGNVKAQMGYEPRQFCDDPMFWTNRLHPEDAERVITQLSRIETENHVSYEYRMRHRDGQYVWLHDELTAVRDSSGRLERVVGSWFDVSQRRRAQDALQVAHDELEERVKTRTADLMKANQRLHAEIDERERIGAALRKSEARQRVILQSVPMATYTATAPPEYMATWVSEQIEHICGFLPERFVNDARFWSERIHADDRTRVLGEIDSLIDATSLETEYRWLCADGTYRWFLDQSILVRDNQGRPKEVIGTWLDIDDRKLAEQELRESSQTLAKLLEEQYVILENTRDFVYRHDTAGVFNYLSPAVEQVTGYSVAEWCKPYATYMTNNPINRKVIEYTENTLRTGKESPTYTVEIKHKNGHFVMLEVNERPYFENGRMAGIIGVARDVTQRVEAQVEVEKAKEIAEAANRAKSVFLANISHEIRTPLTAILGAAELLTTDQNDTKYPPDAADMIVRNGRHLLTLIDDLLDLSRAETGKLDVKRVPTALPDVIADVRAIVEPLYRRPDVDFKFCYDTPIPVSIETDPTRLRQALINLISNALKFTQHGHVWVRFAVDRDAEEPHLTVAVEDTGIGIPADDTERIFKTFSQLGANVPRASDGVGLGLPLTRYIAEKLGGDVRVETGTKNGCTFTLRIDTGPLTNAMWITGEDIQTLPQPGSTTTETATQRRLHGTILLADDFPDTRNLIQEFLAARGAAVTAVDNGKAAVDAAMQSSFDLILMDIRMPGMDGLEATAELRRRGCLTPVIALTASANENERDTILAAGFDDLWSKPLRLDHLASEVAAYVELHELGEEETRSHHATTFSPADSPRLRAARVEFLRNLPGRLAKVSTAMDANDMRCVRELLHQLVGAGGTHGHMDVSHEAARLLELAKRGSLTESTTALEPLKRLVQSAVDAAAQRE